MIFNIGYITPSVSLLGARISLLELLKNLDNSVFNPLVVCPSKGPLTEELHKYNIPYKIIRFGNWRKAKHWLYIPSAIYNLSEVSHYFHIALWHSNEFWCFPYVYKAAKRNRIPTICHFRCSRDQQKLPAHKIKLYNVHQATKIILVSNSQKEIFQSIEGINTKIQVIPNGVDIENIKRGDGDRFRRSIQINKHSIVVGFIGLISKHKGIISFLNAVKNMFGYYNNVKFVLIGPIHPPFKNAFLKSLNSLPNRNDIIVTGYREDMPDVLKGLDILVLPSIEEAFGRVVIEAMAAHTTVVASCTGGIKEIISSERNGVLFPPNDAQTLAKKLLFLIKNKTVMTQLSQEAYLSVEKYYSIQHHVNKIEAIYKNILSSVNCPTCN